MDASMVIVIHFLVCIVKPSLLDTYYEVFID